MARWSNEGLAVGPLQLWIWGRRRALAVSGAIDPNEIVGDWMGVHPDSINRWLERRSPVSEEFVDMVLTRSGRATFDDIYPPALLGAPTRARGVLVWIEMVMAAEERAQAVPPRRCGWGDGCPERVVAGKRFCGPHARILAGIREEIRQEADDMSRGGGVSLVASRRAKGKRPTAPICCAAGCFEPRLQGDRFCMSCQDAGMVEEEVFAA